MTNVQVERTAALSADEVWQELRHFDRVLRWIPGGEASTITVSGTGVGMMRELNLVTQGYVQHRLIAFDEATRTLAYELTAGKPIGMQSYSVRAQVEALSDESCKIFWRGEMRCDSSLQESVVAQALAVALDNMTVGLIACVQRRPPTFRAQPNEDWQLRLRDR